VGVRDKRFEVLDGLRGIAALVVVVLHVPPYLFKTVAPGADLMVDFFFALSGFVLAHAYADRLQTMNPVEFMVRRLLRLWPLYMLGTLLGVAVGLATGWGSFAIRALGYAVFMAPMVSQPGRELMFPLDLAAWSLFFELVANLVFVLVGRRLTDPVLCVLIAAGLALWAVSGFQLEGAVLNEWPIGLGRVTFGFFAGVGVYRLWKARPSPRIPAFACVLALASILVMPAMPGILLCPVLVYVGASAVANGWTRTACIQLGAASYGFYVLHVPLSRAIDLAIPGDGGVLVLALTCVAAGSLALALVRPETALRRWLEARTLPLVRGRAGPRPAEENA
jgi:peptidoglycan/LPS O-acetylase OafA/YrhL